MSKEVRDEIKRLLMLYKQVSEGPLGMAVKTASRDVLFLERLEQELNIRLPEVELFRVMAFIEEYLPRLSAADLMILLSKIRLPEEPPQSLLTLLRKKTDQG